MVGELEQALSAVVVFFVMLGMGASLTFGDFRHAVLRPQGLAIGLACQYGIMPLLGFTLVKILALPEAVAVGLLIIACMPGGTTSNMFTYFARGNLALSVLMTLNSTLCGIIAVPLLLSLYANMLNITVPLLPIIIALVLMMVPVALGMLIRRANSQYGALTERAGSILGIVFILFLIVAWVPRNWHFLMATKGGVYAAALSLGLVGIALGYIAARLLRMNETDARTVGIETGLQNGPMAFSIIAFTFSGPDMQSYMAVPALYSFFIVIVASVVTILFRATAKPAVSTV